MRSRTASTGKVAVLELELQSSNSWSISDGGRGRLQDGFVSGSSGDASSWEIPLHLRSKMMVRAPDDRAPASCPFGCHPAIGAA